MESILAAREPDKTLRNSSLIDFCYIKRQIRTNLGNLILVMLKSLGWIRLIERSTKGDASGGYSHAAGLDLVSSPQHCRTQTDQQNCSRFESNVIEKA